MTLDMTPCPIFCLMYCPDTKLDIKSDIDSRKLKKIGKQNRTTDSRKKRHKKIALKKKTKKSHKKIRQKIGQQNRTQT